MNAAAIAGTFDETAMLGRVCVSFARTKSTFRLDSGYCCSSVRDFARTAAFAAASERPGWRIPNAVNAVFARLWIASPKDGHV